MEIRLQLYYLLKEYLAGNYKTETFCTSMCDIFYPDTPKEKLSNIEYDEFKKLAYASARFSPYPEDYTACSNAFVTEKDIHQTALEVYQKLIGQVNL